MLAPRPPRAPRHSSPPRGWPRRCSRQLPAVPPPPFVAAAAATAGGCGGWGAAAVAAAGGGDVISGMAPGKTLGIGIDGRRGVATRMNGEGPPPLAPPPAPPTAAEAVGATASSSRLVGVSPRAAPTASLHTHAANGGARLPRKGSSSSAIWASSRPFSSMTMTYSGRLPPPPPSSTSLASSVACSSCR